MVQESSFDGGLLSYFGYAILASIIAIFTIDICLPGSFCIMYNWKVKHTVIDGRRLYFDGKAIQLFGNWIKWWFFTVITLGIYSFWLNIKLTQWITKHTHHVG